MMDEGIEIPEKNMRISYGDSKINNAILQYLAEGKTQT